MQLETISFCPIACYLGEDTSTHLTTTSFQVFVESNKVSPEPLFLQAKQPQFPPLLLRRLVLSTLHQLHCPFLDMLQHLNVFLEVNTVFKVWPHLSLTSPHRSPSFPSLFRGTTLCSWTSDRSRQLCLIQPQLVLQLCRTLTRVSCCHRSQAKRCQQEMEGGGLGSSKVHPSLFRRRLHVRGKCPTSRQQAGGQGRGGFLGCASLPLFCRLLAERLDGGH